MDFFLTAASVCEHRKLDDFLSEYQNSIPRDFILLHAPSLRLTFFELQLARGEAFTLPEN